MAVMVTKNADLEMSYSGSPLYEPRHGFPTIWYVLPAKAQISLRIGAV